MQNASIYSIGSRPRSVANTWTTFTPFQAKMATTTSLTPMACSTASQEFVSQSNLVSNPASSHSYSTKMSFSTGICATQSEVLQSEQMVEALAKVTQLQRLPQAKTDVFKGDEKDKTKYFLLETAFDALVDSAPVTDIQKLHLLYQHL